MPRNVSLASVVLAGSVALAGCDAGCPAEVGPRSGAGAPQVARPDAKAAAAAKVARIVFIDKQEACPCTRKRIDDSWGELQKALGTPPSLPVERLFLDTQADQVEPYMMMERLMVPPGIYFLDEHDAVVEMLQGEVQEAQVAALLAPQP